MGKQSKRNQRWLHQTGMGSGLSVGYRLPKAARRRPNAPTLPPDTEFRLRCVAYAQREGVAAAV